MARINTNISSLIAQRNLSRSGVDLSRSLERLSTGLRINRGADDPAGLITSERLRSEVSGLQAAVRNSQRASSVIATTEGALAEVADLLNSIQGLVVESANTGGLSDAEIEANQLQLDSAIASITRISNITNFGGLQLLNGSMDYLTSGVSSSAIRDLRISAANFGDNTIIPVTVDVLSSAQTGQLRLTADYTGTASDGTILSTVSLEIAGLDGVQVLKFTSGTDMSSVVLAINSISDSTGVSAVLASATNLSSGVIFNTIEYGSDAFVGIKRLGESGSFFDSRISNQRAVGQDVTAIVNGALAVGDGMNLSIRNPALKLELMLDKDFAQQTVNDATFTITGGGSLYQIGSKVQASQQINFGVSSIAASRIGGTMVDNELQFLNSLKTGGANVLANDMNLDSASKILQSAIDQIAVLRGSLGAIERNTLQANVRSLQVAIENTTAAGSQIRDADFAIETAEMSRAQILQSAGISVLATANSSNANVLQLLG